MNNIYKKWLIPSFILLVTGCYPLIASAHIYDELYKCVESQTSPDLHDDIHSLTQFKLAYWETIAKRDYIRLGVELLTYNYGPTLDDAITSSEEKLPEVKIGARLQTIGENGGSTWIDGGKDSYSVHTYANGLDLGEFTHNTTYDLRNTEKSKYMFFTINQLAMAIDRGHTTYLDLIFIELDDLSESESKTIRVSSKKELCQLVSGYVIAKMSAPEEDIIHSEELSVTGLADQDEYKFNFSFGYFWYPDLNQAKENNIVKPLNRLVFDLDGKPVHSTLKHFN